MSGRAIFYAVLFGIIAWLALFVLWKGLSG
jgi:hypothetical protein